MNNRIEAKVQYGFYFDPGKCNGCKACHITCKDKFDAADGVIPRRVYEYVGGGFQQGENNTVTCSTFGYYISISCNHCDNPVCVKACPTGAMHKRREDGFVVVAEELCIGCGSCARACPYDAPQLDYSRNIMVKCNGCYDLVQQGKKPLCVAGCTQKALKFDEIDILRKQYGDDASIAPLPKDSITRPNLVIQSTPLTKPSGSMLGKVENVNEV